jgi:hypothetical protein
MLIIYFTITNVNTGARQNNNNYDNNNNIVLMTHPYDDGLTMILKKIVCQNQRILL